MLVKRNEKLKEAEVADLNTAENRTKFKLVVIKRGLIPWADGTKTIFLLLDGMLIWAKAQRTRPREQPIFMVDYNRYMKLGSGQPMICEQMFYSPTSLRGIYGEEFYNGYVDMRNEVLEGIEEGWLNIKPLGGQ